MIPRPPRSTLFPTRRSSDLCGTHSIRAAEHQGCLQMQSWSVMRRSEEHTSELQSRGHLVCRLLLEKKKRIRHASSASESTEPAMSREAHVASTTHNSMNSDA